MEEKSLQEMLLGARPSAFPVRPAGAARSAVRAVGPVSATLQPGPKEPGEPVGPRGAGERGRPLFSPFQSARASLRPFVFDAELGQESQASSCLRK